MWGKDFHCRGIFHSSPAESSDEGMAAKELGELDCGSIFVLLEFPRTGVTIELTYRGIACGTDSGEYEPVQVVEGKRQMCCDHPAEGALAAVLHPDEKKSRCGKISLTHSFFDSSYFGMICQANGCGILRV